MSLNHFRALCTILTMVKTNKKSNLPDQIKCECCGKPLVINLTGKGRIARFCSPVCRAGWHRGKRPPVENLPSLEELLSTIDELSEGTHSFDRELTVIKNILIEYYRQKKT